MTAAQQFGDAAFIRLTTFKRDGTPVPTTVWCVPDGDDVLVTTQQSTGKAKRLRHTSRVLVAPSSRAGRVRDGVPDVEAQAHLFDGEAEKARLTELLKRKYGLQGRLAMGLRRLRRKDAESVGIRISTPLSHPPLSAGTIRSGDKGSVALEVEDPVIDPSAS